MYSVPAQAVNYKATLKLMIINDVELASDSIGFVMRRGTPWQETLEFLSEMTLLVFYCCFAFT